MDEYYCLTLKSAPDETEDQFKTRLVAFWTSMLRNREADYEKIYAESSRFDRNENYVTRQYFIECDVADILLEQLLNSQISFEPLDRDEVYSRYEATSPDWFQLEH